MRYLIDTQILLWSMIDPQKLSPATRNILQSNEIFVSQITLFEIAIKQKIGKLPDFDLPIDILYSYIEQDGSNLLPLQKHHIAAYASVPLFSDHRDPFDRVLLANAMSENIIIISADANFPRYAKYIQIMMNSICSVD